MRVGGSTATNQLAATSGAGAPTQAAAAAPAPNTTGESIDANMAAQEEQVNEMAGQFMESMVMDVSQQGMQMMEKMQAEQQKKDKERQAELKKG